MILAYGFSMAFFSIFMTVAAEPEARETARLRRQINDSGIILQVDAPGNILTNDASNQSFVTQHNQTDLMSNGNFLQTEETKVILDRLSSIAAALETMNGRLGTLLTGQNGIQALIISGFQMLNNTLDEIKKCLNCTQLQCPDGYRFETKFGPFCYRFESNRCKSWSSARSICQNEGGDLMIPDVNTYQFFRNLAKTNIGKCKNFWIGGYTSTPGSNYVTVNGVSIPITFPFWSIGQPDGLGGESCIEMRSSFTNYLMNDYHCNVAQGFVCQIFP